MKKKEGKFFKLGFWAPFKSKTKEEFYSPKGYVKELGNRFISVVPAATAGSLAGYGIARAFTTNSNTISNSILGGALVGTVAADVAAIRKGEAKANIPKKKRTGAGRYMTRQLAEHVVGIPIEVVTQSPAVGTASALTADYFTRKAIGSKGKGK